MKLFKYINKDNRPWGLYYVIHDQSDYKIKRIEVNPNEKLSYQYHNKRSEAWTIISGTGDVIIDDKVYKVKPGVTLTIPKLSKHRIHKTSNEVLVFIEVQTGDYFGEDDIVRIEDQYNRK